jgi:hydrogenase maturation factor
VSSPTAHAMATDGRPAPCDAERGCITCGDVAVEMAVVAVSDDGVGACADPHGRRETVDLALVAPVAPGDAVLVHAGVALVRLGAETRA